MAMVGLFTEIATLTTLARNDVIARSPSYILEGRRGNLGNLLIICLAIVFLTFPSFAYADDIPTISRDSIIAYAQTGVGSPYIWGGDKWDPNNRSWGGADCSGYILKAWRIPYTADYTQSVGHPYNTYNFFYESTHWDHIDRSQLLRGDIMVYRSSSGGHAVVYHYGDKWGSPVVYEARSRATGIVHGQRYFPSSFKARRRHKLVDSDPKLMASVKSANGSFRNAVPQSYASNTMYFDYTNRNGTLNIANIDSLISAQVSTSLFNRSLLGNLIFSINAQDLGLQTASWPQEGYLHMVSLGQNFFASRQDAAGFTYLAKNKKMLALSNFVDYFIPSRDILLLTNPNNKQVNAFIYVIKKGKIYNRQKVKIAANQLSVISYKKSRFKRLPSVYIRVDSKGGRIMATKKSASSYYLSSVPASRLSKNLLLQNFDTANHLLFISNPNRRKAKVSVRYINNNQSYLLKRLAIAPRDLVALDTRSQLSRTGDVFLKIISNVGVLASKKMANDVYQTAETESIIDKNLVVPSFNPTSDQLYITNPFKFNQTAQVDVITGSAVVYSGLYPVAANSQQQINLLNTSASSYPNTFIKITASL